MSKVSEFCLEKVKNLHDIALKFFADFALIVATHKVMLNLRVACFTRPVRCHTKVVHTYMFCPRVVWFGISCSEHNSTDHFVCMSITADIQCRVHEGDGPGLAHRSLCLLSLRPLADRSQIRATRWVRLLHQLLRGHVCSHMRAVQGRHWHWLQGIYLFSASLTQLKGKDGL